jgi:two-component system cell cycle response regulator DivK
MAPRRVLYVEDNFENRLLIKRVLEAEGYIVYEADSGATGLQIALAERPDLILMDINLADIDGYEVTARLRKIDHLSGVPVVALTAYAMPGDRERCLDAGCDGYIPKPIDVDELPNQIAAFIGGSDGSQNTQIGRRQVHSRDQASRQQETGQPLRTSGQDRPSQSGG